MKAWYGEIRLHGDDFRHYFATDFNMSDNEVITLAAKYHVP